MQDLAKDLKALGQGSTIYVFDHPAPELLEWFPNPSEDKRIHLEITAPEFTSLCPKTGQPDFAEIFVEYTPNERCLESKSFKLYLGSFRNHGEFHEACVERIGQDLLKLLEPISLRVEGRFSPRGGIRFWPTFEFYA